MSIPNAQQAADATHTFDQLAVQQDPLLGQVVGNYHVLALAGEGTSGRVYRARDVRLDRVVALKVLRAGAVRERFEQEARALARLGMHPGVVDVYTWGEHAGQCYLALEYLPESAASLLARRPEGLPMETVLSIGAQCAEALDAAHAAGVVHGDIKPSNILLSGEGATAKVCDFGLCSLGNASASGGSPAYLAPECAAGGTPTFASDIYSLAATIYALICGQPPIGETDAAAALAVAAAGKIRPLAQLRPGLPRPVLDLLAAALAQDPARRPASAAAFALALRDLAGAPKSAAPRKRIGRTVLTAAAVLAAALIVLVVQTFLPGGGAPAAVLADARISLNQGKYEAARAAFEEYLQQQPQNTEARYGLAYSFLLEGDREHAAAEFSRVGEAAMQKEGQAAVAYMASGEAARPTLEQAAQETPGGYASVLLAMLDMMSGKFDTAQERLGHVKEDALRFDWQRRQYLQTLGQLYFKAGKFPEAEAIFARLEKAETGTQSGVAADFRALSRERAAAAQQEDFSAQLARIREAMKSAPAAPVDAWTSRPLRPWIAPIDARQGVVMQESGLAEVLPWRLSRGLLEHPEGKITPVEREAIGAVLAEQELSSKLASGDDALRLGRVLGARLMLSAKVSRVFNEELLHVSLVDTETTRWIPVGEYKVTRDIEPARWIEQIRADLARVAAEAYPLRGKLVQESGAWSMNIGQAAGVAEGQHFRVLPAPDALPLAGIEVIAVAPIAAASSGAKISGDLPAETPTGGWLIEQPPAPKETAHAS